MGLGPPGGIPQRLGLQLILGFILRSLSSQAIEARYAGSVKELKGKRLHHPLISVSKIGLPLLEPWRLILLLKIYIYLYIFDMFLLFFHYFFAYFLLIFRLFSHGYVEKGAKYLAREVFFEGKVVCVRVGVLVGDGDAKIDLQLSTELPADLSAFDRFLDSNHIVKNFSKKLYCLKASKLLSKKAFSPKVILALKASFAIELYREGTVEEKKKRLENIPKHFFNVSHDDCGDWCKAANNPTYLPSSLPYSKWLEDETITKTSPDGKVENLSYFGEILGAIQFYATEQNLSWVDSKKSTNINEAYNGLFHGRYSIGGKANLAPRAGIVQNQFACCSMSTSHSSALAGLLSLAGVAPTSGIIRDAKKRGEEEVEKKEKEREKRNSVEGKKRRKGYKNKKKVGRGKGGGE